MDAGWKRKAAKQRYVVTTHLLRRLREIEYEVMQRLPPSRERRLQTRETMALRELRDAALLCHGLAARFGETIGVTHWEEHDHDAVALIQRPGESCFYPLQMKQLPPNDLNPQAELQSIIESLPAKYPRSPQLTVGVSLNRDEHIDFRALTIPAMNIGGLFFFGASSPDQSEWILWATLFRPIRSPPSSPTLNHHRSGMKFAVFSMGEPDLLSRLEEMVALKKRREETVLKGRTEEEIKTRFDKLDAELEEMLEKAGEGVTGSVPSPLQFTYSSSAPKPLLDDYEHAQSLCFVTKYVALPDLQPLDIKLHRGNFYPDNIDHYRHMLNEFRSLIQNEADSTHFNNVNSLCKRFLRRDPSEGPALRVTSNGTDVTEAYRLLLDQRIKALRKLLKSCEFGYIYNGILQHSDHAYTARYIHEYTSGSP